MATYNTKYYANFYSKNGDTHGALYFKKKDYTGQIIHVKLAKNGLQYKSELNDWLSSNIVNQSLSISLFNDNEDFDFYNDLMELGERDFIVEVSFYDENNNNIKLFKGWLNSELVEQRYLNNSTIRLTASNYLSKLTDKYAEVVKYNKPDTFINILYYTLQLTGGNKDIYVNNKLKPHYLLTDASKSCFNTSGINPEVFWKNNEDRDSGQEIITSILKPFDSYLYAWNDSWYIERFGDLWNGTDTKEYIKYDQNTTCDACFDYDFTDEGTRVSVSEPSMNLCDLTITGKSQILKMTPGLKELSVTTKPKKFINMFPVDFRHSTHWENVTTRSFLEPINRGISVHDYNDPSLGLISTYMSNWNEKYKDIYHYVYHNLYGTDAQLKLNNGYDTNLFCRYYGLATQFRVSIPDNNDSYKLNISYKWNPSVDDEARYWHWKNRYFLGYKLYWWLMDGTGGISATSNFYIKQDSSDNWYRTGTGYNWAAGPNEIIVNKEDVDQNTGTYTVNIEIPLTDVSGLTHVNKYLTFGIGRATYETNNPSEHYTAYVKNTKIGDINIQLDTKEQENELKGTLDNDFINKQKIDLKLYDGDDYSYSNSILTRQDLDTMTDTWYEEGEDYATESYPLTMHILRERLKTFNKNRKTFEATFIHKGPLKPFTLFNDDNDSSIKYMLVSYTHSLMTDTFKGTFLEYDNTETINIIE